NLGHFAYSDQHPLPITHQLRPVCPTRQPSSRDWSHQVQAHSQSLSETADSVPSPRALWRRRNAKATSPPDSPVHPALADHANERSPPSAPDTSWGSRGPRSRYSHWFDDWPARCPPLSRTCCGSPASKRDCPWSPPHWGSPP